ncbi:Thermolabile hemolysin [Termitomyces sp. T112]|nr:Thermolabile hemolysin [Termitomyces sp. T112]KAH0583800.1 hypothetical protein H2248_009400 [Termitomyces sp. 'cryptogamus']
MSKIIQVAPSWPGLSRLSYMMIFGDSYSSIGFELVGNASDYKSTAQDPLGLPFPGLTWNEEGLANWVGHLLTKYVPRPSFIAGKDATQDPEYLKNPLLVYNYAIGGDNITGVQRQINRFFLSVGQKPAWAPWTPCNSLFITWVGINDCSHTREHKESMTRLFKLQEELYGAGARNFLFVDVPPIDRSPAVPKGRKSTVYQDYNAELETSAEEFAKQHPETTVLLHSSAATFNRFLDSPEEHGFSQSDCRKPGGAIWYDYLHPTSKVHDYVARDLGRFLETVEEGTDLS